MKNKVRKFVAGFFLTLLIPAFLGGQWDRPQAQVYLLKTHKKQMAQLHDFQRVDMEEAFTILP